MFLVAVVLSRVRRYLFGVVLLGRCDGWRVYCCVTRVACVWYRVRCDLFLVACGGYIGAGSVFGVRCLLITVTYLVSCVACVVYRVSCFLRFVGSDCWIQRYWW